MKLEQQVTSLKVSQKMNELGFKQESLFKWIFRVGEPYELVYLPIELKKSFSAYTVAELYSLLYSNGICDILITVKPKELADYLAEMLCKKLSK